MVPQKDCVRLTAGTYSENENRERNLPFVLLLEGWIDHGAGDEEDGVGGRC